MKGARKNSTKGKVVARRVITTIRPSVVNGQYFNNSTSFHYSRALFSQTPNTKVLRAIKAVKKNNKTLAQALQLMRLELRNREDITLKLQEENMELQVQLANVKETSKEKLRKVKSGLEKNCRMLMHQIQVIQGTMDICMEEESYDRSKISTSPLDCSLQSTGTPAKKDQVACKENNGSSSTVQPDNNQSKGLESECSDEEVLDNSITADNSSISDQDINQKNEESISNEKGDADFSLSEKSQERTPFDMTVIDEQEEVSTLIEEEEEELTTLIEEESTDTDIEEQIVDSRTSDDFDMIGDEELPSILESDAEALPCTEEIASTMDLSYTEKHSYLEDAPCNKELPIKSNVVTRRKRNARSSKRNKTNSLRTRPSQADDSPLHDSTCHNHNSETDFAKMRIKSEIMDSPTSFHSIFNNSWTPADEDFSKYVSELGKENVTNKECLKVKTKKEMPSPIVKIEERTPSNSSFSSPPKRPSRRAKEGISFKEPSLMKKMRR